MVEVQHHMAALGMTQETQETREDQETQEDQEDLEMSQETLETLWIPETLTIMKQGLDHTHRGRKEEEIIQEIDIDKSIETHHGIEIEIEDMQTEATAEKGKMIEMLTGTEGQAMAGGAAEKVARSPWVMGGLL